MSGFVAIIAEDGRRRIATSDLTGLADAYARVRGPGCAMLEDGRAAVWVLGGPDDAVTHLERRSRSWAAAAGVVHHDGSLLDLDLGRAEGQFALLRRDAEAGTITLASDPFGMFGLFVARRDGLAYAATSSLALARHLRAAPSRIGIESFLIAGYQCGSRTAWEGIERVAAGVAIEFSGDGVRESTYWRPRVDSAIRRLSLDEAVDRCLAEALDAVRLAGRARRPVWCDLTGGYDSRLLGLLARAADLDVVTTTSGPAASLDARLARAVAQAAGWEWVSLPPPDGWERLLPDRLSTALGWGDASLEVLQLATVLWAHEVKSVRARRLLNGGGGEHYWSYAWQHEYGRSERSGPADLDTWVRLRMLKPVPTAVFERDPTAGVVADLLARMEPVVEPYLDEPRATQSDILYAHKSTGHFGAYAAAGGAHLDVLLPFYTRASFTAAFSTHPRHRFGHRFYRRLIDRLDPRIAALPTAKGGPAQPRRLSNLHAFAPYYARLVEKGLNKAAQRVLGRSLRRAPAFGDASAAAARAAAVARVGGPIDDWRSRSLYDGPRLARLLSDAGRPDQPASVLLGRILTVELALRAADATLER